MIADDNETEDAALLAIRSAEIVVALLFLGGAATLLFDSVRLGFRWVEGQGPAPGYFPFHIGLILATASLVNLVRAVAAGDERVRAPFTTKPAALRVLTVLVPALLYVALVGGIEPLAIPGLGIYVASAVFIIFFMVAFGGDGWVAAILVGLGVPLAFFLIFEKWFLVPLPKGPLEAYLGLA